MNCKSKSSSSIFPLLLFGFILQLALCDQAPSTALSPSSSNTLRNTNANKVVVKRRALQQFQHSNLNLNNAAAAAASAAALPPPIKIANKRLNFKRVNVPFKWGKRALINHLSNNEEQQQLNTNRSFKLGLETCKEFFSLLINDHARNEYLFEQINEQELEFLYSKCFKYLVKSSFNVNNNNGDGDDDGDGVESFNTQLEQEANQNDNQQEEEQEDDESERNSSNSKITLLRKRYNNNVPFRWGRK
jgi:hypothetical protein